MNESNEMLKLDTGDIMNEELVNTVRTIEDLGKNQYKDFQRAVLVDCTRSIHEPIKKNSLPPFKCPTQKEESKQADEIANLKADISLFSQLFVVAQDRETDMDMFFQHKNNPFPPSLSDRGTLHIGKNQIC